MGKNMGSLGCRAIAAAAVALLSSSVLGAAFSVGAAPKGDANTVASRIIKENFPTCKRVSMAKRMPDGSIRATCGNANFMVFTVFNPKEGRTLKLAMNCAAAKKHLNIDC